MLKKRALASGAVQEMRETVHQKVSDSGAAFRMSASDGQ